MNKKSIRQHKLYELLKTQGTGIVSMSDSTLSSLLNVSTKTIQRDLEEMNYKNIIIKQTRLIRNESGNTRKQRDIIIPGEPQRRFSLDQHRFLSNTENHDIFVNEFDEVIWMRRPDGIHWERSMPSKEFKDVNQAKHYMLFSTAIHNKKYKQGDSYVSRNDS